MPVQGQAHPSGRLVIRLFGALEIEDGPRTLGPADLGGTRPKQVLEILLSAGGHRVPTERLAELLWGADRPKDTSAAIQTFVSVLRRHLTPDRDRARQLVVTESEAYRFGADLVELDLRQFDDLLERSARQPTRSARRALERALALVRGEVLEDEPYAAWAEELRSTYNGRVLGARLDAADAALAELDYAAALAHAQAAAALDGFSERAHRTAMLALYALGRQTDALDAYRQLRDRLDGELGLQPTPETRALEGAILRQDDIRGLLPRPIRHDTVDNGDRSVRLLGRSRELARLDRTVRHALDGSAALVLLEGEAGLGKTRLLDELATSLVGVRVGRASASPLERHLPYVPLAAALRNALAEVPVDGQLLPGLGRSSADRHGSAGGLADLDALEAVVELIGAHAPLVLLIDDLQWADASTIAALSYLRRRCSGVPAAFVAAVRSEDTPADHPARHLQPDVVMRLEPLTAADLAPLGIPDLLDSTGGNPRFVTEALATGSDPGLTESLAESLLAQCRGAGARAYRILLTASLLEQPWDLDPLVVVLRIDPAELVDELDRLCELRILRIEGQRFRFRYGLVREVLRTSLSPARARLVCQQLRQWDEARALVPSNRAGGSREAGRA